MGVWCEVGFTLTDFKTRVCVPAHVHEHRLIDKHKKQKQQQLTGAVFTTQTEEGFIDTKHGLNVGW